MTENNVILTGALFQALNAKRKNKGIPAIENTQIAVKLGILFTLKTHNYVNFKGEYVVLKDAQILELHTIIKEYFNIDLTKELFSLMVTREKMATNSHHSTPSLQPGGLINKIKGVFKTKLQEEPA